MLYPIYVHLGDNEHAHGVTVPDFPGCFSAADNWDDLPGMVQEAIEVYCDGEDMFLPEPSSLEQLMQNKDYQNGIWIMLDIDVSRLHKKSVHLNVSLPTHLLSLIDHYANHHQMTRSGFLSLAAQEKIEKDKNETKVV